MNYSNWYDRFYNALEVLELNAESEDAAITMFCWAQNGSHNPDPTENEKIKIYRSVMSSIEIEGLESEPYYKDIYNL